MAMRLSSVPYRSVLALGTLTLAALVPPLDAAPQRPNVVMIVVDDLRFDEIVVAP